MDLFLRHNSNFTSSRFIWTPMCIRLTFHEGGLAVPTVSIMW